MVGRASQAALGALIVGLLVPATSSAGTYTTHDCQLPSGDTVSSDGWAFTLLSPLTGNLSCRPTADGSRPTQAGWLTRGTAHANGEGVELTYTAPPGTEIADYTLWRQVEVHPASTYNYYYQVLEGVRDSAHIVDRCEGAAGCARLDGSMTRNGLSGLHQLWLELRCQTNSVCPATYPANAATLGVSRTDITLRDDTPPVLNSTPSGTLLDTSRPLTGPEWVSVAASDVGGGVYQVLLEVDGKIVDAQTIDRDDGRCEEPFAVDVPCPASAAGTIRFDTSSLPDGEHLLRILVTDATGENAAPYGPIRIQTLNSVCRRKASPHPGTRLRVGFAGHGKRTSTLPYGRVARIRGRLVSRAAGEPVVGARICVAAKDSRAGARLRPQTTVLTNRKGQFSYRAPKGPSRTIRFANEDAPGEIVAAQVHLRVPAGVRLAASPHRLHNGQTVRLSGRLRGRPYPRSGVLVEIQARRSGGWQTFGTAKANRAGRFHFVYEFTRTSGVQVYKLRASVPRQAVYPYAAGASHPVRVRVRG
jgi:hypothetical protein